MVHLVFCESFDRRHKKCGDRFLLEKRGDRSPALLDTLKIFHSQLVMKLRHRYLRKTYLWLSAVLLEMSLSQKSRKLAIKPRRRSPLSKNLKVDSLREAVRYPGKNLRGKGTATRRLKGKHFVPQLVRYYENKLTTLANQNWGKNQQSWLTNKKSLSNFLQEGDVKGHD